MNTRWILFLILSACSNRMLAQNIILSPPAMFDTVLVNTTDSLGFWIRNTGATPFTVTDINTTRPQFTVRDTSCLVPANDSVRVYVYFMTNQNVTWSDVLLVVGPGLHGALPLRWRGTGRYPDILYNSTQGLWDNALKTALTNLVTGHTSLGYNAARDRMFETIDDYNLTDTVECVYIGRRIHAATRTEAQNQNFNTEHTWPQSFFNSDEPMVSDLNHLFPTDAAPNSARANYPFGPVVSNITYNVGGSKLGHRADGASAFEPRDIHKGDVARALFYFTLRYGNLGNYMDATQHNDLRAWYKTDPVSAKEMQRNNGVATYQGKRNPLIDHPEFIDRISSFISAASPALFPDVAVSVSTIQFGNVAQGDSLEWKLFILNNGRATLNIGSLTLQSPTPAFRIVDMPATVPVDSFAQVRVRFVPTQPNQSFNNNLIIQSNDPDEGTVQIGLTGTSTSAQVQLLSPPDHARGISSPVEFTWQGLPGTIASHFQLSTSASFATLLISDSTLAGTTNSADGLDTLQNYYWRVCAKSIAGWGPFSSVWQFRIAAGLTVAGSMNPGWNIISIPVIPVDSAVTTLFPAAVSSAFAYSNGYTRSDTLHTGPAYWLKFGPSPMVSITGEPLFSKTIDVIAGWNFIGSISFPISTDSVASSPPGIILSSFFEFDGGYTPAVVLSPLKGYWVKCSQAGQIFLSHTAARR